MTNMNFDINPDDFRYRCVRCGECCKASACGFGEYDHARKQCKSLVVTESMPFGYTLYGCGIYDEIIKDPTSVCSPAFGAGCCRTMCNPVRREIMRKQKGGK